MADSEALDSLSFYLDSLAARGWDWQSSPGIWTDVCRAVERLAVEEGRRRLQDRLFAHWIERAPRFGAVAVHFPKSLRCRRFVASFWAVELFFTYTVSSETLIPWYPPGPGGAYGRRRLLDVVYAVEIDDAPINESRYFWALELFFAFRIRPGLAVAWYSAGGNRADLDAWCAYQIASSLPRVCRVDGRRCDGEPAAHLFRRCSDCPGSRFWSPELPEVDIVSSWVPFGPVICIRAPSSWKEVTHV